MAKFRREFKSFADQNRKSIETNADAIQNVNKTFVEFKEKEFPKFMKTFKEECVLEVI